MKTLYLRKEVPIMKTASLKDNKFLKDLLTLLNVIIGFCLVGVLTTILLTFMTSTGLLSRLGIEVKLIPTVNFSDWLSLLAFVATILTSILSIYLIYLARNFIKNLLEGKIFDRANIKLASQAWKIFLALTFLSIRASAVGDPIQLPFSFNASLSALPLLGALIIWIMMKILENGIEIAEENQFTI